MMDITCPRCAMTFKVDALRANRKVQCDLCGWRFLRPHRPDGNFATFRVSKSRTIVCPGCGLHYKVDRRLLIRNLHCEVCERSFPLPPGSSVKLPALKLEGIRSVRCPVCALAYKAQEGIEQLHCKVCDIDFVVEERRQQAEQKITGRQQPPSPPSTVRLKACQGCGARYIALAAGGGFECGVCNRKFEPAPAGDAERDTVDSDLVCDSCPQCGLEYRVGRRRAADGFVCDVCGSWVPPHTGLFEGETRQKEAAVKDSEPQAQERPGVAIKLDETRRMLLDLSRRNRLLNHKSSSNQSLQITHRKALEVFQQLVVAGRRMHFLAREEGRPAEAPTEVEPPAVAGSRQPEAEVPVGTARFEPASLGKEARHRERSLLTDLDGTALQTRLVHLARRAASAQQEQGYNILYLTLGLVCWPDGLRKTSVSRAPLVFVPVELRRPSVHRRHNVRMLEDEVVTNPCLVELCAREFRWQLPEFTGSLPEELGAYFEEIQKQLAALPGWTFKEEINLGLFSFAKLLMYRDLDYESWPDNAKLDDHPLIATLAGMPGARVEPHLDFPDPATLDARVEVEESFQILDADSSQQAAILAAKQGANLVIQGPPGTGKSQTIANTICECLAAGRTVLFVAEKAAALDVVKRRLSDVGLGDFVLELHSRKTSKKAVLKELQRSLETPLDGQDAEDADPRELVRLRAQLNNVRSALHTRREPLGLSLYEVVCRSLVLSDANEPVCDLPGLESWDQEAMRKAGELVDTLDRRLERLGDPQADPWRGAGWTSFGMRTRQGVEQGLDQLVQAIGGLRTCGRELADLLGCEPPLHLRASRRLQKAAQQLLEAPELFGSSLGNEQWDRLDPALSSWLEAGQQRAALVELWNTSIRYQAEEQVDWLPVLERRRAHGRSIWRFFRPSWYRDNRTLRENLRTGIEKPGLGEQLELLQQLVRSAELRDALEVKLADYSGRLGIAWQGLEGPWHEYRQYAESLVALRATILELRLEAAQVQEFASRPPDERTVVEKLLVRFSAAVEAFDGAWKAWLEALESDAERWLQASVEEVDLEALLGRLQPLFRATELAHERAAYNDIEKRILAAGLREFLDWVLSPDGERARGALARVFARHYYRLWLDREVESAEVLREFRGEDQDSRVERFRKLDRAWIELSRRRLRQRLLELRPGLGADAPRSSKLGIIKAEMRKKTRFMPLRKLFGTAGNVVQKIKPCFMMSPLSVAQFLIPGAISFDVVIFDEASQVEPADAFGAIARGRQLLLVGDEKQLPPTSFFNKIDKDSAVEPDDDPFRAGDLESVLGLGLVHLPHTCLLRWHYRSRHASLIDFSNRRFYDSSLRIFPGPHIGREELGVSFVHVPHGVYDRGRTRTNAIEAGVVAQNVLRHALREPELSLGVAAFSLAQQQAIEDELETLRRSARNPAVERFFKSHLHEPFFVKNLETVQGDERDVIFLSVGYGRDASGKVAMNFGPLNREGGWRRLNVLVTRARRRCFVFSSIRAEDVDSRRGKARGVVALKQYLHYAEHGHSQDLERVQRMPRSGFEALVRRTLQELGWEVHAGVGNEGFAIDLAVVDPRQSGHYLLGIEGDGETYRQSSTARDRERLRCEVLERLGWSLCRVWSWDWYQQPKKTRDALLVRLRDALKLPIPEPRPAVDMLQVDLELAAQAAEPGEEEEEDEEEEDELERGEAEGQSSDSQDSVAEAASEPEPAMEPPAETAQPAEDGPEAASPLPQLPIPAAPRDLPEVAREASEVRTEALADGLSEYIAHPRLYLGESKDLQATSPDKLAQLIHNLVYTEGPLALDQVVRTLASWYGTRATKKRKKRCLAALQQLLDKQELVQRGDFLWHASHDLRRVRYRGGNCPVKEVDAIPSEEFEAAVMLVVAQTFGQSAEDLTSSTVKLMGYGRAGGRLSQAIEAAVERLRKAGRLVEDNAGFLVLPEES